VEPIIDNPTTDRWTMLGTVLLWLGVAVWGVYAVLRWGLGHELSAAHFLPFHLAGVIPGLLLRRRHWLLGLMSRQRRTGPDPD
jgi:hypothetical protein